MKLRRFKLIKEYTGSQKLGTIAIQNDENSFNINGILNVFDSNLMIYNDPEHWREIKNETVLITEDGKELVVDDYCYRVDEFEIYPFALSVNFKIDNNCKYFSIPELAEKWIKENKPKWNDNDMIKFVNYNDAMKLVSNKSVYNNLKDWEKEKLNYN